MGVEVFFRLCAHASLLHLLSTSHIHGNKHIILSYMYMYIHIQLLHVCVVL